MKQVKYSFNMVEIMLAIVIIAVGMSSVFVLFPTGLNAHKTAVAENSIADLAEYIVATVRADIEVANTAPAADDGSGKANKIRTGKKFEDRLDNFKDKSSSERAAEVTPDPDNLTGWDEVTDYRNNRNKEDISVLKNNDGIYWARQLSGPENDRFVDFSAIARVYRDANNWLNDEFFIKISQNGSTVTTSYEKGAPTNIPVPGSDPVAVKYDKIIMPLVLEISYPADAEYEQREKRYFRFEIFNESYEPDLDRATPKQTQ